MLAAILPTGLSSPTPRPLRPETSAFGWFTGFVALAIAWTWPLTAHLASRIPHDPGDSVLNIWLLWWNAHRVPFSDAWWSPPFFVPMQGALALSEHLAGFAPLTTPLQWMGGSPLMAYNVAFLLSFALSGFFAFLLVRRILGGYRDGAVREVAALGAGLAYGFGPYRAGQLAHLQVLTSQWMPLALLAMHGYAQDGRRRWLVLFAGAWLVQALSNGYYLLFVPVLLAAWLLWSVAADGRLRARSGVLACVWIASSLPLVPVLLRYSAVQRHLGLSRTPEEMVNFSARPVAFFHASGLLRFWPTTQGATTEEFLFPGITPIVLIIAAGIAAARRRAGARAPQSALAFYACAAVLMWALALGPAPAGAPILASLRPYTALAWLPGYGALRVPARFAMLATLGAAVASGLAFARLAPSGRTAFRLFAAVCLSGFAIDGWMRPMPLATPPGRVNLPDVRGANVLELPLNEGAVDTAAMYRAIAHGRPVVNGYSGHTPPHYAILSLALRRSDPSVLNELARGRPLIIIVHPPYDAGGHLRHLVEGLAGVDARGASNAGMTYVLPGVPSAHIAQAGAPWPVLVRSVNGFEVTLDLGSPRVVRTIGFPLRWHFAELDPRISVQASEDGVAWNTVWEGWTGGPALAAALEDPREAPVRLTVPDVRARFVRVYPADVFLQRDVNVFGPK